MLDTRFIMTWDQMSDNFIEAHKALDKGDYDLSKYLFDMETNAIGTCNLPAWNNKGVAKVRKADDTSNVSLAKEGKADIEKGLSFFSQLDDNDQFKHQEFRTIASENVEWANEIINRLE